MRHLVLVGRHESLVVCGPHPVVPGFGVLSPARTHRTALARRLVVDGQFLVWRVPAMRSIDHAGRSARRNSYVRARRRWRDGSRGEPFRPSRARRRAGFGASL
jgi:hypothetical protein